MSISYSYGVVMGVDWMVVVPLLMVKILIMSIMQRFVVFFLYLVMFIFNISLFFNLY